MTSVIDVKVRVSPAVSPARTGKLATMKVHVYGWPTFVGLSQPLLNWMPWPESVPADAHGDHSATAATTPTAAKRSPSRDVAACFARLRVEELPVMHRFPSLLSVNPLRSPASPPADPGWSKGLLWTKLVPSYGTVIYYHNVGDSGGHTPLFGVLSLAVPKPNNSACPVSEAKEGPGRRLPQLAS